MYSSYCKVVPPTQSNYKNLYIRFRSKTFFKKLRLIKFNKYLYLRRPQVIFLMSFATIYFVKVPPKKHLFLEAPKTHCVCKPREQMKVRKIVNFASGLKGVELQQLMPPKPHNNVKNSKATETTRATKTPLEQVISKVIEIITSRTNESQRIQTSTRRAAERIEQYDLY